MKIKNGYMLGRSGRFNVVAPYETIVKPNVVYTIKGALFISELIRDNVDVFTSTYSIVGLDRAAFEEDKKNNVIISIIVDSSGNTIYIPEYKIVGACIRDGVEYVERTLLVNIGAFPKDISQEPLLQELLTYINSRTGVLPKGELIDTSIVLMIPTQEDINLKASRVITNINSPIERIKELERLLAIKQKNVDDLECIIKQHNIA